MKHQTPPAITGIVAAAACAGLITACAGGPAATPPAAPTAGTGPTTTFAYGIPSPPNALFHVEDSTVVSMNMPTLDMEVSTMTFVTMNLVFGRDPAGIGVVGNVVGFDAVSNSSLMGITVADADDVSGPIGLVLTRGGELDIGVMPVLDSTVADLTPFPGVFFDLFPRLPDFPVGQGGEWVDTVLWSVVDETSESVTQTIFTYTLVGDTVVEGRSLLNIGVEGDIAMQTVEGVGDELSDNRLSGTSSGYILWDPEHNLPWFSILHRDIRGTNQVPGVGRVEMAINGPIRVRVAH